MSDEIIDESLTLRPRYVRRLLIKSATPDAKWTDEEVHDYTRLMLPAYASSYTKKGDRFAAWQAIALCRWAEVPIPKWAMDYIGRCAEQMDQLSRAGGMHRENIPTDLGGAVLEALELKRRGSRRGEPHALLKRRREFTRSIENQILVSLVIRYLRDGEQLTYARESAAKEYSREYGRNIDTRTVERAWKVAGYNLRDVEAFRTNKATA